MNDDGPKVLGVKHHDNFITEITFDPERLELGQLIDYFEFLNYSKLQTPRNDIRTKDTQIFINEICGMPHPSIDEYTAQSSSAVYQKWNYLSNIAFGIYFDKYEVLKIRNLEHKFCKLQRTKPSEGFHDWHSDQLGGQPYRQIVSLLYLNDDFEGGETEFLHQSVRIKPQVGKYVLFPAFWTHLHRGNPPIGGDKYIITGWLEEYPTGGSV